MPTSRASTRRAAHAAFLLFAAALFVVGPAEASRTTTNTRSSLAPSSPLELVDSVESSPRFGFGEDLGLLHPEAGPGSFVVFAAEAAQRELTYARNNPLKYVDPDGRMNDWAYGPFSDNNPKTPIQWNSVTPQQKAVEGALMAITTAVAIAPLAVAAPAVLATVGNALLATAVAHPTATAAAVGGVKIAAEGVGASPSGGAVSRGTEVVQRAMSGAELAATRTTELLRGGRSGTHFVSDAVNSSAARARMRLSLGQMPEFRVTLGVPAGRFSAPSRVLPANGMPGGGMERTATGPIPVQILGVTEY